MPWKALPAWPPVRHPHEVFLMAASVLAGVMGLAAGVRPDSINAAVPFAFVIAWQVTLVICGTCTLLAAWFAKRDALWSLLLERIGCAGVGIFALLYAATIAMRHPDTGLYSICFIAGYGIACLVRWRQVQITLSVARHLRRRAQEVIDEVEGGA